jgi:hypothetical protein
MSYKLGKATTEDLYMFGNDAMTELWDYGESEREYLRLRSISSRLRALADELAKRYMGARARRAS